MNRGYDPAFRQQVVAAFVAIVESFPSTSAAAEVVAREHGVSRDSVRRWASKSGQWDTVSSQQIRILRAENEWLRTQLAGD